MDTVSECGEDGVPGAQGQQLATRGKGAASSVKGAAAKRQNQVSAENPASSSQSTALADAQTQDVQGQADALNMEFQMRVWMWVHCCLCMSALVVLDVLVPISLVRSLLVCNQSREFDNDGELQPTNATGAHVMLGVDMLSQVSSENTACVVPLCPAMLGMLP